MMAPTELEREPYKKILAIRLDKLAQRVRHGLSTIFRRPNAARKILVLDKVIAVVNGPAPCTTTASAASVSSNICLVDLSTTPAPEDTASILPRRRVPSHAEFDHITTSNGERLDTCSIQPSRSPKVTDFHQFATFPPEIRLLVWQYAVSVARLVEIQYPNANQLGRLSPPTPAILHVCRESRNEALKGYAVCFGGTVKLPRPMYINPTFDTIFFRAANQIDIWRYILRPHKRCCEQFKDIRRIAFLSTDLLGLRFMKKNISMFPKLEELIIVWARDWHLMPRTGEGLSYFENVPGPFNSSYNALRRHIAVVYKEAIEKEPWWNEPKWKAPVISVRQWCSHKIASENR